jgi:FixJ family two-component response regulator
MNEPATVYFVDDDAAFQKATSRLLSAKGYRVVGFASAEEFLAADVRGYGCVLLDVRMPGLSGLQLQQVLADRPATPPIIFITGHGSIPMSVVAIKGGAEDFLAKPVTSKTLVAAIEAVLGKSALLCRDGAELEQLRQRYRQLTPREVEVFERVVRGLLNKQIAAELGTTERTVKAHRFQVMRKMAAASVQQLVGYAQKLEL